MGNIFMFQLDETRPIIYIDWKRALTSTLLAIMQAKLEVPVRQDYRLV